MPHHTRNNIGAHIVFAGLSPKASSGATVNGAAIDRTGFQSCKLRLSCGAATGTPTTQTADLKLQDSADGSTGWADVSGAAVAQLTADNTNAEVSVDLAGAKRYVRLVEVVAFTGGTTPTLPVASVVAFGGDDVLPAALG